MDDARVPLTVAGTPAFSKEASRILGEQSHQRLIEFLGLNPESGAVIPGTGGVRKLRWAVPGHSETLPLLALNVYAKSEKTDINPGEKKRLKAEVEAYIRSLTGDK